MASLSRRLLSVAAFLFVEVLAEHYNTATETEVLGLIDGDVQSFLQHQQKAAKTKLESQIQTATPNPETGAWDADDLRNRHGSSGLNRCMAEGIAALLAKKQAVSVSDLGAGNGVYSRAWKDAGFQVHCYDGNPVIETVSNGLCKMLDLSERHDDIPIVDYSVSLEVAEHIPAAKEANYLSNIDRSNKKGVIISWAHPGQDGDGHVNLRSKEYVTSRFADLGYSLDELSTAELKSSATCNGVSRDAWNGLAFEENILVFARKS